LGKTNFALALGMRIAAGANFLHWEGRRACKVLYIDGEMSRRLLKQRLAAEHGRLMSEVSLAVSAKPPVADGVRPEPIHGKGQRPPLEELIGELQFKPDGFHSLSTEDIPNFQPLNTRQGQAAIEKIITEMG